MDLVVDPPGSTDSDRAEDLQQPVLRDFHHYWNEKRGARRWPSRHEIDALDLKPLLGRIAMLDVLYDADALPRFRYRLFGTAFVDWFGFDLTGRTLDDWPAPEYRGVMNASYREVVIAGRPFRRLRSFVKDDRIFRYEAVMLPLGGDTRIDQVIVAQVFLD